MTPEEAADYSLALAAYEEADVFEPPIVSVSGGGVVVLC
jgi:hypothetical protein